MTEAEQVEYIKLLYILNIPLERSVRLQEPREGEGSYPTSGSVVAERVEAPTSLQSHLKDRQE